MANAVVLVGTPVSSSEQLGEQIRVADLEQILAATETRIHPTNDSFHVTTPLKERGLLVIDTSRRTWLWGKITVGYSGQARRYAPDQKHKVLDRYTSPAPDQLYKAIERAYSSKQK